MDATPEREHGSFALCSSLPVHGSRSKPKKQRLAAAAAGDHPDD